MARIRDERTYITVHDGIEDHPKIAPLSDKAFRLLITTWGWCNRHKTDGVIPAATWKRRGTAKVRNELVKIGLILERRDEFVMHDYLEHQWSKSEINERREEKRSAARIGNHKRWHEARGVVDPECVLCQENPRNPIAEPIAPAIANGSQNDRKPIAPIPVPKDKDKKTKNPAGSLGAHDLAKTSHSPTARRLVEAYAATCHKRPPSRVLSDVAVQVDALLGEDWTPEELAPVLAAWGAKGLHPKTIPSVAHEVTNSNPAAARKPTVNGTDAHFAALFASQAQVIDPAPPQLRAIPGGNAC